MKKSKLLIILFFVSSFALNAQDSYLRNRWNSKAGYASYPGLYVSNGVIKNSFSNYRIEANYGFLNFLEAGGYFGYSRTSSILPVEGQSLLSENQNTPFFGLTFNFHPLTFLVKSSDFRFDIYLLARYGGVYYSSPQNYSPARGLCFQYQHGGGIAFYLTKHIGLFGEYGYGNLGMGKGNFRYGLTLKF